MLGAFLEFGLTSEAVGDAFEIFRSLGFHPIDAGDILNHPYAVVSDGDICIGLHERPLEGPLLTFVRPGLKDYLRALRRRRIEPEFSCLAPDEFNELGFRDPNGQMVTLLEARTFSPGAWTERQRSVCGTFLEFSVATHSTAESLDFWGPLGFEVLSEGTDPHPWLRLRGRGLTLGFHQVAAFRPALTFAATDLPARIEYLRAKGFTLRLGSPLRSAGAAATLLVSGAGALFIVESEIAPA